MSPSKAPPMEFIASSTQTEEARDWFTIRITELMNERHIGFVEAARDVARGNLTGYGERATRSANAAPFDLLGGAPLRNALAFSVAHYHGADPDPELPLVASHLGANGIARVVLEEDYGAANTTVLEDPTAAEMLGAIRAAVARLGTAVAGSSRRGELTIFFDGHGNSDGMIGSDEGLLTLDEVLSMNETARAANVQLIVISNGCFQGAGVLLAEQQAHRELRAALEAAQLPLQRRQELGALLEGSGRLVEFAQALTSPLEVLGRIVGGAPHAETPTEAVDSLRATLTTLEGGEHFVEHGFAAASPELSERIRGVWDRLPKLDPVDEGQIRTLVADLDVVSDKLTEEVARLQELVQVQLDLAALA